jgi:hypothetical protein
MIMLGEAESHGTLSRAYPEVHSHLLAIRDSHLEKNSWDDTIKKQLDSAYTITKNGKNNYYGFVKYESSDHYLIDLTPKPRK